MPEGAEHRRAPRFFLHSPTVIQWRSGEDSGTGTVSNMSVLGCYVLTQSPRNVGERLSAQLEGVELPEIGCEVRYIDEKVGMGLKFVGLAPDQVALLTEFLRARHRTVAC